MTPIKIIFAVLAVLIVGGLAYFAFSDIHVTPQQVEKEIPHDRLVTQTP